MIKEKMSAKLILCYMYCTDNGYMDTSKEKTDDGNPSDKKT